MRDLERSLDDLHEAVEWAHRHHSRRLRLLRLAYRLHQRLLTWAIRGRWTHGR